MTYRFGVFEFESEAGVLLKDGRKVSLEPQPAKALARLLADSGNVVTREELREAVWGGDTHVDFDRGLAYCLSQIRGALGDSGDNPRFVQTLPRKGYRFIAPVERVAADPVVPRTSRRRIVGIATAAAAATVAFVLFQSSRPAAGSSDRQVVAVSIFDNETGNAAHDRMVAGLADLVVVRLAELAPDRIAVIGNAAVLRQSRNIRNLQAVKAGVRADYVVLGQLQAAETGLRFITHLIRLSDGTHLKANRIALPDGNVAGLESAVLTEFERAVRVHILSAGT